MKTTRPLIILKSRTDGFTLTDLLAILLIGGILGTLLVPVLASTKPNSQAFQCLENQRQIARGWQMYSEDNRGKLAPNGDEGAQPTSPTDPSASGANLQWCPGQMQQGAPAGGPTNAGFIMIGCIYPYTRAVTLYHCPADHSTWADFGQQYPRIRSISMNAWLNPINIWSYSAHGRFFHNETDLGLMGSANTWLFMDENPYSIDDAYMPEYPPPGPSTTANLRWVGYPASYHDGGAGIVFCDGHGLIKKWTDPVVLNMRFENPSALAATTNNPDLPWLQAVSTRGQ